ncbi:hypothetical protein SYNPS1DRAFT_23817 [Syncephalis pseudoplumigaleata]|uniref:Translation initiation factor eIF2B subunit gamma n=1 Tax=Syncephalis pseudoplumigaleata TaxID=1712513 RepID=A0A4P9YW73_9FUNG|nr:hypothetical protein SYNPS1DRAFT_23817 [Syncephalis pseudoplumigaleata]|eukprot:RKP24085.1 hypothetical protein SYNPS1DRAFT_23817 [Syncephalis pseudoplumigaleata]
MARLFDVLLATLYIGVTADAIRLFEVLTLSYGDPFRAAKFACAGAQNVKQCIECVRKSLMLLFGLHHSDAFDATFYNHNTENMLFLADDDKTTTRISRSTELQAVVLAGYGNRLGALTEEENLPKALLPVANRPMIAHVIAWVQRCGIHGV